ncbi:MAG: DUF4252 domain-containing protein [Dysgonomonas sp.]|nr:DUF4252 domain-containing protein [Dysgonomonas sp.]
MKKYLCGLVLLLALGVTASAQDLNTLIAELAKVDNVQHQVIDKEMLKPAVEQAKNQMGSNFMEKIEEIEVAAFENYPAEIKDKVLNTVEEVKKANLYETLLSVKDKENNVTIFAKKDKDIISEVFIVVVDDEDAVVVKMSGSLSESDLNEIINEQKKNFKQ